MYKVNAVVLRVVVLAALVGVGAAAMAQQRGAGAPQGDPNKITVVKRPYDKKQMLGAPVLAEDAFRGRTIWLQRCAYCHDGVGQPSYNTLGPWMGAETVAVLGDVAFRAIVAAGTERMPGFSYALTQQQVGDVIAFLKTVPSSKKPTPNQLAGKAETTGNGD